MEWYVNNREVIKNLALNTGTTESPTYTPMCTTTEVGVTTDFEQQDWYVFCDAIQRSLITGVAMSIETTIKIDMNNAAITTVLGNLHSIIKDGSVAQYNNQTVQFELLTSVKSGSLEYTKYNVPCVLNFSDLGGAAEDSGEFTLTIVLNGKGTVVAA